MPCQKAERQRISEFAARRVEAAWTCVGVLCPDLPLTKRKALTEKVLDLCHGEIQQPAIRISPAQVTEIVWRNFQCANRYCSAVLFSELIAEELNEFFGQEE